MTICIPWLWLDAVQLWFCSKAHECGLLNQTHYNIILSEIHTYIHRAIVVLYRMNVKRCVRSTFFFHLFFSPSSSFLPICLSHARPVVLGCHSVARMWKQGDQFNVTRLLLLLLLLLQEVTIPELAWPKWTPSDCFGLGQRSHHLTIYITVLVTRGRHFGARESV
jgi:hypothetical protein